MFLALIELFQLTIRFYFALFFNIESGITVVSKKNNAKQRALAAYKTVYEFC